MPQMEGAPKSFINSSVIVIVIGNGHGNLSSNSGWGCLHFHIAYNFRKGMYPNILSPEMAK